MPRSRSRFQQKIYMNNIFSEVLYLISSTGNAPAFHLDAHKIQIYPAPAIAQPRCLWLCSATTIRTIKKKKKKNFSWTDTHIHTCECGSCIHTHTWIYTATSGEAAKKKKSARTNTQRRSEKHGVLFSSGIACQLRSIIHLHICSRLCSAAVNRQNRMYRYAGCVCVYVLLSAFFFFACTLFDRSVCSVLCECVCVCCVYMTVASDCSACVCVASVSVLYTFALASFWTEITSVSFQILRGSEAAKK